MVSGGVLVEGCEIRLGMLTFIADDSAWLQEAPLDVDALPVRGATHFRACVRGVCRGSKPDSRVGGRYGEARS